MKILMTTDTIGGVWTYAITLCRALQTFNVQVALATMGRPLRRQQRQQAEALSNTEIFESDFRLCWMQGSSADVAAAGDWLLQLERTVQPDLVHLNDLGHGGLPWRSPLLLTVHSCVYSWWHAVHRSPPPEEWSDYRNLVKASVLNADLVVAPTAAMLQAFLHHYLPRDHDRPRRLVIANGRDWPPLAVCPDGSCSNSFDNIAVDCSADNCADGFGSKKILSRNRLAFTAISAEEIIFAAGRLWDPAKNIGALSAIANSLPWPIYVAGESKDPNGGRASADNLHGVGFLNHLAMARWLYRAKIFVAPALYEPFGLAILEAARAGCALVLSDIPNSREVWGHAASYVPADDAGALRACLLQLIDDPALRARKAAAAWRRAQHFSEHSMAMAYHGAYRDLLGTDIDKDRFAMPAKPLFATKRGFTTPDADKPNFAAEGSTSLAGAKP